MEKSIAYVQGKDYTLTSIIITLFFTLVYSPSHTASHTPPSHLDTHLPSFVWRLFANTPLLSPHTKTDHSL